MKPGSKSMHVPDLLLGLTAGASAALAISQWVQKNPDKTLPQRWRNLALDRALHRARTTETHPLEQPYRYVIFSDHHRGARDNADDFRFCEQTYLAALQYYDEMGYTLILLGDVEELLEQGPEEVLRAYSQVLQAEGRFYQAGRYIRIAGNHDGAWASEDLVRQYLDPLLPGIQVKRELLFEFTSSSGQKGEILLAHGHQGTLDSDIFDFIPPRVLPLYRDFQNLTNLGHTSPSRDDCLRALQDTRMYRWVSKKNKLILIAGHTHRPVWSSLSHLDKLVMELHHLLKLAPDLRPADYMQQIKEKKEQIEIRAAKYPPCNDTLKSRPCYFNTGSCRFEDGDITGIEIVDGRMALIKWGASQEAGQSLPEKFVRTELESMHLEELFAML